MATEQDQLALPSMAVGDPGELLAGFLDCHRDTLVRKIAGLSESDLRAGRLPSGWSPLGLVKHLTHVERRWLRWGFLGEELSQVWGDTDPDRPDGPWYVAGSETVEEVLAAYEQEIQRSRQLIAAHSIMERAAVGGRFDAGHPVPTLGWILGHLVQEYARHVGQLDVVRELIDGTVGE